MSYMTDPDGEIMLEIRRGRRPLPSMTDVMIHYKEEDPFDDETCPVCGSPFVTEREDLVFDNREGGNDNVFHRMSCDDCGSEWTHTYWIANTLITRDGRFPSS